MSFRLEEDQDKAIEILKDIILHGAAAAAELRFLESCRALGTDPVTHPPVPISFSDGIEPESYQGYADQEKIITYLCDCVSNYHPSCRSRKVGALPPGSWEGED